MEHKEHTHSFYRGSVLSINEIGIKRLLSLAKQIERSLNVGGELVRKAGVLAVEVGSDQVACSEGDSDGLSSNGNRLAVRSVERQAQIKSRANGSGNRRAGAANQSSRSGRNCAAQGRNGQTRRGSSTNRALNKLNIGLDMRSKNEGKLSLSSQNQDTGQAGSSGNTSNSANLLKRFLKKDIHEFLRSSLFLPDGEQQPSANGGTQRTAIQIRESTSATGLQTQLHE